MKLTLPADLYAKLQRSAEENDRSIDDEIVARIERSLAEEKAVALLKEAIAVLGGLAERK
ncbi:MAG: Arc family DNA-binding protein [Mesorhizobium sp.]|uniref:Arc family DNA-binding protein n=1 Tax=Mesorhizobium sp. TaxID=1871066 RepID=UPI0012247215|nr:Arc family DNA-binding protein [Mesorhizobium sp.]TIQ33174.1 MAG: Arc family DNA-binding protein [Mesorhizobium sp.]